MSCYTEMERKCSNRRMAGEIRKTKYQSIRNLKPIHIYTHTHARARAHTPTHTHTSTPRNTRVKLHILSLKWSTRHPNVEKHQIFKLLHFGTPVFWDVMLHHWLHEMAKGSSFHNCQKHDCEPLPGIGSSQDWV